MIRYRVYYGNFTKIIYAERPFKNETILIDEFELKIFKIQVVTYDFEFYHNDPIVLRVGICDITGLSIPNEKLLDIGFEPI